MASWLKIQLSLGAATVQGLPEAMCHTCPELPGLLILQGHWCFNAVGPLIKNPMLTSPVWLRTGSQVANRRVRPKSSKAQSEDSEMHDRWEEEELASCSPAFELCGLRELT